MCVSIVPFVTIRARSPAKPARGRVTLGRRVLARTVEGNRTKRRRTVISVEGRDTPGILRRVAPAGLVRFSGVSARHESGSRDNGQEGCGA